MKRLILASAVAAAAVTLTPGIAHGHHTDVACVNPQSSTWAITNSENLPATFSSPQGPAGVLPARGTVYVVHVGDRLQIDAQWPNGRQASNLGRGDCKPETTTTSSTTTTTTTTTTPETTTTWPDTTTTTPDTTSTSSTTVATTSTVPAQTTSTSVAPSVPTWCWNGEGSSPADDEGNCPPSSSTPGTSVEPTTTRGWTPDPGLGDPTICILADGTYADHNIWEPVPHGEYATSDGSNHLTGQPCRLITGQSADSGQQLPATGRPAIWQWTLAALAVCAAGAGCTAATRRRTT